jgi:predicted transcriptional regulator
MHNQKEKLQYKQTYHPNAFLKLKRNVKKGLKARTKILELLNGSKKKYEFTVKDLSRLAKLSYYSSFHHLRLLENEQIVKRQGKRPYKWKITGKGQKVLTSFA